jgi:hypothetical protein
MSDTSSDTIDQELVDRIIDRAKVYPMGLDNETTDVKQISQYSPQDSFALAMTLVGSFHDKYDLVAVFQALYDELTSKES